MQISVAKVIKSLINLVYAVNLITIKAGLSWGRLQDQGGVALHLPGAGTAASWVQQVGAQPWEAAARHRASAVPPSGLRLFLHLPLPQFLLQGKETAVAGPVGRTGRVPACAHSWSPQPGASHSHCSRVVGQPGRTHPNQPSAVSFSSATAHRLHSCHVISLCVAKPKLSLQEALLAPRTQFFGKGNEREN